MNVFEVSLLVLGAFMSLGQLHSSSTNCYDTTSCPNGYVEESDEEFFEALDRIFPPTSEQDNDELSISVEPPEPEMWNAIESSPMPRTEMPNEDVDALEQGKCNSQIRLLRKYQQYTGHHDHTYIRWGSCKITDWPSEVFFYRPACWSGNDYELVAAAIDNITFIPIGVEHNGKRIHSKKDRSKLLKELQQLSKEKFGSERIPWRTTIRHLMPDPHLTSCSCREWTNKDVDKVKAVIEKLREVPIGFDPLLQQSDESLRRYLRLKLVNKCNADLNSNYYEIPWSLVIVHNWPASVTHCSSREWTAAEMSILTNHITSISFEYKITDNVRRNFSLQERRVLAQRLAKISQAYFDHPNGIAWQHIKEKFPSLNLMLDRYESWTIDECLQLTAIAEYCEKEAPVSIKKSAFSSTSEQDNEELGTSVESPNPEIWNAIQSSPLPRTEMPNEDFDALHSSIGNVAQIPPIEAADSAYTFEEDVSLSHGLSDKEKSAKCNSIHAALLKKYIEASGNTSAKTIQWNRVVTVKNWPQKVLFYYSGHWPPDDVFALEASLDEISFVTSESAPQVRRSVAKEMHRRLCQLNCELFSSTTIRWRTDIKSLMPDLHLTTSDYSFWNAIDMMKIEDLIALLESLVNSRAIRAADCNDCCDEMQQVDLLAQGKCNSQIRLLRKYQQYTGHRDHTYIHWGNYKVTNWPSGVFFYSPAYWSVNDAKLVAAAINNITFIPIGNENNRKKMYSVKDRSKLLKELQQLSKEKFGSERIPWNSKIRYLMPDPHLTSCSCCRWTNEDVDKVKAVIEKLRELPNGFNPLLLQKDYLLRQRLQLELVNKCNADLKSNYKEIPWPLVIVHNWPENVSCNSDTNWTAAEMSILMNNMMNISFKYKITDNVRRNFSLQERRVLAQRLGLF